MFANLGNEQVKWKIASRLEKKSLLIAVNALAGLAIFFFGESPSQCFNPTGMAYVEARRL